MKTNGEFPLFSSFDCFGSTEPRMMVKAGYWLNILATFSMMSAACSMSASSMISPVLSVATRAINNNHLPLEAANVPSLQLPYPPLIFPAAEFAPGNHVLQGRSTTSNNAKGETFSPVLDHYYSLYSCVNRARVLMRPKTWKVPTFYLLVILVKTKNGAKNESEWQEEIMWKDLNSIQATTPYFDKQWML